MKKKFTLIKFKSKDHIFNYCKKILSDSIQNKKKILCSQVEQLLMIFIKKL